MWFKQLQLFKLNSSNKLFADTIMEKLEPFAFRPCLPSMESSMGWITPLDSDDPDAPLVRTINDNVMICLQFEDKILPSTVVRHELAKKIKKIRAEEDRRVNQSERLSLKDEITMTLLPRAFSKFSKLYAYIDTKTQQVILGTASPKRAEQFIIMFEKALGNISPVEVNKLGPIITQWVKHQNYPSSFAIEKSGVLQDPNQQGRVIRCQQQDLFAASIQSLLKDGCEIKQLALTWQDRANFVLADDFTIKNLKFEDEVIAQSREMEAESKDQQFDADFLIMTDILSQMVADLLDVFGRKETAAAENYAEAVA